MQLFRTLLTLSLSAGALAVPTRNTTGHLQPQSNTNEIILQTRGISNFGWVAYFENGDNTCSGKYAEGYRPKIKGKGCYSFAPTTDNVGINWGTGPLSFNALDFYSDGNCKNKVGNHIKRPIHYNKNGAGTCISVARNGGGPVLSVRGTGGFMG